jgi:hypothetical protein
VKYSLPARFAQEMEPYGTMALTSVGAPNAETPAFAGASVVAGAGFEHLPPTLAYRLIETVALP